MLSLRSLCLNARWGHVEGTKARIRWLLLSLGHADSPAPVNGVNGPSEDANQEPASKPSLRLGFAEYCRISNLIVLHLRKMEEGEYAPYTVYSLSFWHAISATSDVEHCVLSEEMVIYVDL